MDWLGDDEIIESFKRRAVALDDAVERARAKLALDGVKVIDRSNRTGIGEGMPDFWYCVLLEDRRDDGPVTIARVTLSFSEPLARGVELAVVEASWLAEQFWPSSSTSLLKLKGEQTWDGDALPPPDDIANVLTTMMSEARRAVGRDDETA